MPELQRHAGAKPTVRTVLVRMVLLIQLPTLIGMASLAAYEFEEERGFAQAQMGAEVLAVSAALSARFDAVQRSLHDLADQVPPAGGDMAAFRAAAVRTHHAQQVDAIVLLRRDGLQVVNTASAPGQPLPMASPEPWLRSAITGRAGVLDATRDAIGPRPHPLSAGVGVPVVRDSVVVFWLNACMAAQQFQDVLDRAQLQGHWRGVVADSQGVVVASTLAADDPVGEPLAKPWKALLDHGSNDGFSESDLNGIRHAVAYRRSPLSRWTVIVHTPRSELLSGAWRAMAVLVAGYAVALLATLWSAMWLRRGVVKSLETLDMAASRLPGERPLEIAPTALAETEQVRRSLLASDDALRSAQRSRTLAQRNYQLLSERVNRDLLRAAEARQVQLARELHDDVGATLVAASLLVRAAADDPHGSGTMLVHAQEQLQRASASIRSLATGLMPAGVEPGGLERAMARFAAELSEGGQVQCAFRGRGGFDQIDAETATHVYRVVQEAVNNAIRHGHARRLRIHLVHSREHYRLTVRDDGRGMPAALPDNHQGIGVQSMHARARAVDGWLEVLRDRGGGCIIRLTWPR